MAEVILSESNLSSWQWWESRRLRFNIGLIIAGFLAFILYLIVYFSYSNRIPMEIDMTIFTILFQSVAYFFYMLLANVLFCLGAISENLPRMRSIESHRKFAYTIGFFLSVSLPFLAPVLLAYYAIFNPAGLHQAIK